MYSYNVYFTDGTERIFWADSFEDLDNKLIKAALDNKLKADVISYRQVCGMIYIGNMRRPSYKLMFARWFTLIDEKNKKNY